MWFEIHMALKPQILPGPLYLRVHATIAGQIPVFMERCVGWFVKMKQQYWWRGPFEVHNLSAIRNLFLLFYTKLASTFTSLSSVYCCLMANSKMQIICVAYGTSSRHISSIHSLWHVSMTELPFIITGPVFETYARRCFWSSEQIKTWTRKTMETIYISFDFCEKQIGMSFVYLVMYQYAIKAYESCLSVYWPVFVELCNFSGGRFSSACIYYCSFSSFKWMKFTKFA